MESQINKSKLMLENKEDTDKKKKSIVKKDCIRPIKEPIEENDVIIINNVQDFEKDVKNYIEKMEKQLVTHHSLIALQRLKFKEILSKVAVILDQKEVSYEQFENYFKSLNLSCLLIPKKSLYKLNDSNPNLDFSMGEAMKTTEVKNEDTSNKNILIVESDHSCKKDSQTSYKKNFEKKNKLKRERDDSSLENLAKQPQKRKKPSNNNNKSNGDDKLPNDLKDIEEIPNCIDHLANNNMKFNNNNPNMSGNFTFMNNYNHFIPQSGLETSGNHHENQNYLALAQKMMNQNGNFINHYNEVLNSSKNAISK